MLILEVAFRYLPDTHNILIEAVWNSLLLSTISIKSSIGISLGMTHLGMLRYQGKAKSPCCKHCH